MTRVNTMPSATLPDPRRVSLSAVRIADELVSWRSRFMAASKPSGHWPAASWPPPNASVAREHRVRRIGTPTARSVLLGLAEFLPEILDRIENLPRQLDFFVPREERGIAEQDVENQPLVGLGAGFGERLAVREVHVDVAYFHRGARHLRAESHGDAFVGLDTDDECVLPELFGCGRRERQVWGALKLQRDLRHAASEPLAGAQVERDTRPPASVDLELDGGERLGLRRLGDAVLVEIAEHLLAALPAAGVLTACGVCGEIVGDANGRQYLRLLQPQRLRFEADGLLHGDQSEQLQQVVLDHVARGANSVVVTRARRDPEPPV